MSHIEHEYANTDLECIDEGHRFTTQVWKESHYTDGYTLMRTIVPKRSLRSVRCPECGSAVKEAK